MQEASIAAQEQQGALLLNKAVKVKVGKYTYRFKPMRKYTNWRISFHLVSQRKVNADLATNIGLMRTYEIDQAKVLSLGLLNSKLRIALFHWVYWRILLWRLTEKDYQTLLGEVIQRMDVGFFFLNIETAERINSLTKKMTKAEDPLPSHPEPKPE